MTTPQRQGLTLASAAQLGDPDGNAPAILAGAFVDRFRLPELAHFQVILGVIGHPWVSRNLPQQIVTRV